MSRVTRETKKRTSIHSLTHSFSLVWTTGSEWPKHQYKSLSVLEPTPAYAVTHLKLHELTEGDAAIPEVLSDGLEGDLEGVLVPPKAGVAGEVEREEEARPSGAEPGGEEGRVKHLPLLRT